MLWLNLRFDGSPNDYSFNRLGEEMKESTAVVLACIVAFMLLVSITLQSLGFWGKSNDAFVPTGHSAEIVLEYSYIEEMPEKGEIWLCIEGAHRKEPLKFLFYSSSMSIEKVKEMRNKINENMREHTGRVCSNRLLIYYVDYGTHLKLDLCVVAESPF